MAITARFVADFGEFFAAVSTAETKLVDMSQGANKVEASLNRMVDSFSGRKVVQEATLMSEAFERLGEKGIGLTSAELGRMSAKAQEAAEKLRAMGQDVPPGIQRIADATKQTGEATQSWTGWLSSANGLLASFGASISIGAIVSFGRAILDDADHLVLLSDKTQIGVETLQRLRMQGIDTGVGLDTLAQAFNKLQQHLGDGGDGVVGALQRIGLQLYDIKKLSPEQQFYAVAEAIKGIKDPSEQVSVSMALMGRGAAEALPAIRAGFDGVKNAAPGMSTETVKALDAIGDAIGRMWQRSKSALAEGLVSTLTGTSSELRKFTSDLLAMGEAAEKNAPKFGGMVPPGLPKDLKDIEASFERDAVAMKKAAEEAVKFEAAMQEVDSAGQSWQETLNTLDGAVAEAIKGYLEAGVSQQALATAYGLTAAQAKAVAAGMKDSEIALQRENRAVFETTRLWDEYHALRIEHGGTTTDAEIAQIDRWYRDTVAKLQAMGAYNAQTAEAAAAVWHQKLESVGVDWGALAGHSRQSLQDIADKARATYQYLLGHSSDYTADFIRRKGEEAFAAERAAQHWAQTFDEAGQKVQKRSHEVTQQILDQFGDLTTAAEKLNHTMGGSSQVNFSTFQGALESATEQRILGIGGGLVTGNLATAPLAVSGTTGQTLTATQAAAMGYSFQEIVDALKRNGELGPHPAGPRIPGFADGVQNFSGGLAMVGERGPEIVQLPKGSNVIPHGGSAGVTIHNTFHIVDTESALVRRVSDAITRSVMRGGFVGTA